MALWHLGNNITDHSLGTELLPAAGRPKTVKVVAVDAAKGGVPVFEAHGATKVGSLWGELFWQFGGKKTLDALGKADSPDGTPHESQLKKLFPEGPVLILLDELVIYMAKLSERGQGNLLGFLNSLTSVVSNRPQTALVVTDPAGQAAYAKQAAKIAETLAAPTKLDEVFGRKMTDFDPIGSEAPRVIARRLFEKIQDDAAQEASATYLSLYQRVT
jgi:predicted AAA+ superfamily ATPase